MKSQRQHSRGRAVVLLLSLTVVALTAAPGARAGWPLSPENWCCEGRVGDLNLDGKTDITDLAVMIDNLFLTLTPLPCWGEADFNHDYDIDITDLQVFLDVANAMCLDNCYPFCAWPPTSGSLVSHTGCKGLTAVAATDFTPDQSCVVWDYDGIGRLAITHVNAGFNCCPELDITVDVRESIITLHETETMGQCNCLCLFDLEFEVVNLPPGEYRIVAEEPYVSGDMERIDFTVDFAETPQGSRCVSRTAYPWGNYE